MDQNVILNNLIKLMILYYMCCFHCEWCLKDCIICPICMTFKFLIICIFMLFIIILIILEYKHIFSSLKIIKMAELSKNDAISKIYYDVEDGFFFY